VIHYHEETVALRSLIKQKQNLGEKKFSLNVITKFGFIQLTAHWGAEHRDECPIRPTRIAKNTGTKSQPPISTTRASQYENDSPSHVNWP
jgi:hypothetical protein